MKTISLISYLLIFTFSSVIGQTRLAKAPSAGQTAIRSVVAQGVELRLLLHVEEAGTYEVNICSTDGEIVYRQSLQEQAGEVEQKIPFAARLHGVYVVNVVGVSGQSSRQVMW